MPLIGIAAVVVLVGATAIVVYMLTSSKAKADARKHNAAVVELVRKMRARVDRLTEMMNEAKSRAASETARAAEIEASLRLVFRLFEALCAKVKALEAEAERSAELVNIAGTGLSVSSVRVVRTILDESIFGEAPYRCAEAFEAAVSALRLELNAVADAIELRLQELFAESADEWLAAEIVTELPPSFQAMSSEYLELPDLAPGRALLLHS